MFDDLAAFYHENVVASYLEYRDRNAEQVLGRSRDLRSALAAATALFHLREHLPAPPMSRAQLEAACADYGLLGDIVNAAKHRSLNHPTPHGAPYIAQAGDLQELYVITEYADEAGTYSYKQKVVSVRLVDGSERDLMEVLTNVLNYWEKHMKAVGVLNEAREFKYDGAPRMRNREECDAQGFTFELVRGLRWKQAIRLLRFDPATGKADPVDLTGCRLDFNVYKPRMGIAIALKHPVTGDELRVNVALSDEESSELSALSDTADVQAYVSRIPRVREALQQLLTSAQAVRVDDDLVGNAALPRDSGTAEHEE